MTVRFPKWLIEEPFDIAFCPTGGRGFTKGFRVTIWDKTDARHCGYGMSVSAAAKAADCSRRKFKKPIPR